MDLIFTAFSTFLGAAVALTADRLTKLHDTKLAEEAAVNNLILDLASKRAFLTGGDWVWADGEVQRVVNSIHHTRTLIRDARLALRPRSRFLAPLREMSRACNAFLERSEREDGGNSKAALKDLADHMKRQVDALHEANPKRILHDDPGKLALHSAP